MAPVGRPRTSTRQGVRAPVNQIGVADPLNYGVSADPRTGNIAPWRQFIDVYERVPELMWPRSLTTYGDMRRDSQLAALVTALMWGITQLRFLIDPNGARPSLVQEVAEDLNLPIKGKDEEPVGRMKRRFSHHKFSGQALLSVIYGHMFFEQNGDIVDGKWRLRKMFNLMPQTIAQINTADDGGLVNVVQWAGRNILQQRQLYGYAEPIPVDRLTAFVFQQEGYNWVGRSMMHDCFKDWVMKDRLQRVESINHERAGGVPYAVAPMGASVVEIEDLSQMMQQFRIGEDAGGAVPFGSEIKIAKGTGSDIDKTIMRYDQSMARRFMMMIANLAQGGQHVGSYALGDIFDDLWHVGQRAIAQWYCDTVNEHIIEDIADWNYGEDEDLVPKLTWERTREDSLGVEQLATLVQRGVIIVDDEVEAAIRYKYQLPARTEPRPPMEVVGPGVPRQPPEAGVPSGAPSSVTPAPTTQASFWSRFKRKPDVLAAQDGPVLVTVPNVEILHAGIEYNLRSGPRTFTPEDLRDAVMAANEDPSIPQPRLKIGHIDPRFNDPELFDGTPSFGKATNLRLSDNAMAVYADYVGVPKWLADIMPTAFPSRSVEGYNFVSSQMGKTWRFVLSACSVLGVTWPGVTVLEDLPQYFGAEIPPEVVLDPALVAAMGGDPRVRMPFKKGETAAAANLDDVRRAFYNDYTAENPDSYWWWIQAVLVDPNELVVEDDETGKLFKLSFSADAEGKISFGEPEAVRIDYIPDTQEANKAAAAHVAATLAIGRKVLASYPKREDSVLPTTATGGAMDPKEIRKRLGLPEDASDEQVKEAVKALNAAVGEQTPPAEEPKPGEQQTPPAEEPKPGEQQQPAPPAPQTPPPVTTPPEELQRIAASLPAGIVLVDKTQYEATVAAATEARDYVTGEKKKGRAAKVDAAIGDGRIAPASRDHWIDLLEKDPNAEATLDKLQPGLIPLELRGELGSNASDETGVAASLTPEVVAGWSENIFPEVQRRNEAQRTRQALLAAGATPARARISADATYKR